MIYKQTHDHLMHLICLTENNGTGKGMRTAFRNKVSHLMIAFQPCFQKQKTIVFIGHTVDVPVSVRGI